MTDEMTPNGLLRSPLIEALDSRVYHMPTNLMPPSPPAISNIVNTIKTNIGQRYYALMKSSDLIKNDSGFKEVKPATKSDVKAPQVPSKYSKTYELERFYGNRMIIFNHFQFRDSERREGTQFDVAALMHTFKKFRFDVQTHNDLTRRELMETLANCKYL